MVEGVKEQAIRSGLMEEADWDQGIRDLSEPRGRTAHLIIHFSRGKPWNSRHLTTGWSWRLACRIG